MAQALSTGERVPIEGTSASIVVPRGYAKLDAGTWGLELERGRAVLLKVQRVPEPEIGAQTYVDQIVAAMHSQGNEDLERDEAVTLGDLRGRLLEAVELRGNEPASLWLVVLVAEDGMYTATVAGPAVEVRSKRAELEAFLTSLRVPLPSGATRPEPPKVVDPLGIEPPKVLEPPGTEPPLGVPPTTEPEQERGPGPGPAPEVQPGSVP